MHGGFADAAPLVGHITLASLPYAGPAWTGDGGDDAPSCLVGRKEVVMLEKYFLRLATLDRIRASWIGAAVERYVEWLDEKQYAPRVVFARVPTVVHFGDFAEQRGARAWDELPSHVDAFVDEGMSFIKRKRKTMASRRRLRGDLRVPVEQMLRLVVPGYRGLGRSRRTRRPFTRELPRFFSYLALERGVCLETIYNYDCHITSFEKYLAREGIALAAITPRDLTEFVAERAAGGVHKTSLCGVCNCLRVFLRYAHRQGAIERELSAVVDGPLVYRLSTVPRSIPWNEVKRLIGAVDRRDATGKRDYTILLLLVTYGLRVKEVASLLLDDIDWKHDRIRIRDRKIGNSTGYPLTPAVGESLIEYIRSARPETQDRHVFMRRAAPRQPVGPAAISARMRTLLARAGISVPRPGGQVFRHSCVQRLVDTETPYKTISDYVGHRSTLSQGAYAKVSVEALRDVALGDGESVL
jgi:site-specific recombinase XerD